MIKWIFFDLGSTLIDETDCIEFRVAETLKQAGCSAREACMVGDRLDNDIVPAAEMGMSTVWVRQGWFGMGNANLARFKPNFTVDIISDVSGIFLT